MAETGADRLRQDAARLRKTANGFSMVFHADDLELAADLADALCLMGEAIRANQTEPMDVAVAEMERVLARVNAWGQE